MDTMPILVLGFFWVGGGWERVIFLINRVFFYFYFFK
jgi:hypothetical protein